MMTQGPPSNEATLFIRCSNDNLYIKPTLLTVEKRDTVRIINQLEEQDVTLRIPHLEIREVIQAGSWKNLSIPDQPMGQYPYMVSSGEQSVSGSLVLRS